MTREPDRYEAKANAVYAAKDFENDPVGNIAAALRAEVEEALERAARALDDEYLRTGAMRYGYRVAEDLRAMKRALASPAAAPAADYDPITAPIPEGDMNGPHGPLPAPAAETPPAKHDAASCPFCPPFSAPPAPSLLPRVVAALEGEANQADARWRDAGGFLRALAAELRRYVAEMEGK